jgi:hypothetical protein
VPVKCWPVESEHGEMDNKTLEVTLLGTGSPIFVPGRYSISTLIRAGDEYLLFDCGRGASIRLHEAGLHPGNINKLFLTHLHSTTWWESPTSTSRAGSRPMVEGRGLSGCGGLKGRPQ